jgi:hypothetical protein
VKDFSRQQPDDCFVKFNVCAIKAALARPDLRFGVCSASRSISTGSEEAGQVTHSLKAAGFAVETKYNRRDLALKVGREIRESAAQSSAPLLGIHILMGPAAPQRHGNESSIVEYGTVAPVEMIARAVQPVDYQRLEHLRQAWGPTSASSTCDPSHHILAAGWTRLKYYKTSEDFIDMMNA